MTDNVYHIPVVDTISTAWDKVSGSKKTFWGALLLFFVVMIVLGFIAGFLEESKFVSNAIQVIANVVGYFLQMGLLYIGIRRALDLPIEYKQMFRAFEGYIAIKIVLLYILQILIFLPAIFFMIAVSMLSAFMPGVGASLPIILLAIGGIALIYLSVRMIISNALVLDKATSPWQAIVTSFRATRCNFWACFALVILQTLIIFVSAIPLGIGLIWTLPLTFICYGTIYKRLMVNA